MSNELHSVNRAAINEAQVALAGWRLFGLNPAQNMVDADSVEPHQFAVDAQRQGSVMIAAMRIQRPSERGQQVESFSHGGPPNEPLAAHLPTRLGAGK